MSDYPNNTKSFGINKRKYIKKNKNNKKKQRYSNIKCGDSSSGALRCMIKSEINGILNSSNKNIDYYIMPSVFRKSGTWWDCNPWKITPTNNHQC
jgi:hypothetical protein